MQTSYDILCPEAQPQARVGGGQEQGSQPDCTFHAECALVL